MPHFSLHVPLNSTTGILQHDNSQLVPWRVPSPERLQECQASDQKPRLANCIFVLCVKEEILSAEDETFLLPGVKMHGQFLTSHTSVFGSVFDLSHSLTKQRQTLAVSLLCSW